MKLNRRQLLQALGLGALSSIVHAPGKASADSPTLPTRLFFYVQPHGHIPNAFRMAIPDGPTNAFAERSLTPLALGDLSPTLQPLHPFRDKLLAIEGLANTAALADIAAVLAAGSGDHNNHQVAVADVLSGTRALQRKGTYCTGGARTVDQVLATRLATPGRFNSRVYGSDYIPNSIVSPFSYLGPGQAAPMVSGPATAFSDLLGYVPEAPAATDREALLRSFRPSVLDTAAREYELLAPSLDAEGRQKLEAHRDLVKELQASLGVGPAAHCTPNFDSSGHQVRQFMSLARLAFACDLTRIITYTAPVPDCPELGYPSNTTFHTYGHESIEGATSCGTTYSPVAAQAMTDLDAWHANHFAYLLGQLDSVAEGSGTLLDHTIVVWITELATPTHRHENAFTVIAGGGNGFFRTGRYVRYPQVLASPIGGYPAIGPAFNRLLVTLLQAMGQTDTSFGMTEARGADGSVIDMRGPLVELRA